MTGTFKDNPEQNRFEYHVGDHYAYANYRREEGKVFIDKVEAPMELRGTGAANALMQNIVDHAKKEKLQVIPVCSYAVAWMQKRNRPQGPKP